MDQAVRKVVPHTRRIECDVTDVFEVGVLNAINSSERSTPEESDRINVLIGGELDDYPLRVQGVAFVSEVLVQIWIAFPESIRVAVVESRITDVVSLVDSVATPRERIAVRQRDWFRQAGVRGPVALFVGRIAPGAARIPVPDLIAQLGA